MCARAALTLAVLGALGVLRDARGAVEMDEDMRELARAVREGCVAETGVAVAILDAVNGGADLPPDAQLKCYIKCVMETAGMMDEGAVDVEAVLALLPDDFRARNQDNIRACATQPGADHCDVAYNTQACWQRANKNDYFLI